MPSIVVDHVARDLRALAGEHRAVTAATCSRAAALGVLLHGRRELSIAAAVSSSAAAWSSVRCDSFELSLASSSAAPIAVSALRARLRHQLAQALVRIGERPEERGELAGAQALAHLLSAT
jgi:hypothetical protein